MPYFTRSEIVAKLPADHLLEALDDDGDGVEDPGLFDQLVASAECQAHALLVNRYDTPLPPEMDEHKAVAEAVKTFLLEELYKRRGWFEDSTPRNPWSAQAKLMAKLLGQLNPREDQRTPPVGVVSEPSRLEGGLY